MKIQNQIVRLLTLSLIATCTCLAVSCGGGGGGNDDNDNNEINDDGDDVATNDFAGTWLIQKEDTISYWIFREDGTFEKKRADEPINGASHFSGTYSVDGGFLTGKFTNPGVGTGEIEGTIADNGTLLMDFIEFWHSPAKVVPTTGVRQ